MEYQTENAQGTAMLSVARPRKQYWVKETRHKSIHTMWFRLYKVYNKQRQTMKLEVRMVVTGELMTGRSYKDDTEDLWGTGNVSRSRCHLHGSVKFVKIHCAVHLWYVYFSLCMFYFNKKLKYVELIVKAAWNSKKQYQNKYAFPLNNLALEKNSHFEEIYLKYTNETLLSLKVKISILMHFHANFHSPWQALSDQLNSAIRTHRRGKRLELKRGPSPQQWGSLPFPGERALVTCFPCWHCLVTWRQAVGAPDLWLNLHP